MRSVRVKGMVREIEDWPWSSYLAMINKTEAFEWLTTDWILSQFGGSLSQAQNRYRQFVLEGIDQKIELWSELKNQIYLGDEDFVSKIQGKIEIAGEAWGIPKKQRRAIAKSLSEIEKQSVDRNSAIKTAYATGVYSQREIGEHFHLHPSTVGVIVRKDKNSQFGT